MRTQLTAWLALAALALSGCGVLPATPTSSPSTPTPAPTPAVSLPPTASSPPSVLVVWVAPAFAPDDSTAAGLLFSERLQAFEQAHPGLRVEVRVKDESGPGGLLETLAAADAAAPQALPDILTLDPDGLVAAALKEFILPLNGLVALPQAPAWYDFAQQAAQVEGVFFGLPFAADAEILAYRAASYESAPHTWADLLAGSLPFAFPAGDPEARFTLLQYLALGGTLSDADGRPQLDEAVLTEVLAFYASALAAQVLPFSTQELTTAGETWEQLHNGLLSSAVSPLSAYLAAGDFDSLSALPFPSRSEPGISLGRTWSWAIVSHDSARQALAAELLAWLTQPAFLGPWSLALGLLPATSEALNAWPDGSQASLASSLVTLLQPLPSAEVRAAIGAPLSEAVQAVFDGLTPAAAALSAVQAVQGGAE